MNTISLSNIEANPEMEENITKVLNGKTLDELNQYFHNIDKLRRAIFHDTTLIERLNESPNPFYGVVPFNGCLLLEEYYSGPSGFYTPLGKWKITGGGFADGRRTEDNLNSLGIKWTRLMEPIIDNNGVHGGILQIDEDQFGNKYPAFDNSCGFRINPLKCALYEESGKILSVHYETGKALFAAINNFGGDENLLRKEKDNGKS